LSARPDCVLYMQCVGVDMIKELRVSGYRLLNDFTADLGQLTVVIGANATGKSSLLECFQVISLCAALPVKTALDWQGGMASILSALGETDRLKWMLTFQKPTSHPFWSPMPLKDEVRYVYEVTLSDDRYGRTIPLYEALRNEEPYPGYDQPLKVLEATPERSLIFDPRQHKLVPFDEVVSQQATASDEEEEAGNETGAVLSPADVLGEEPTLRLAQMRFLNEYPVPSWTRAFFASFAFYTGFDVRRRSELRMKPADIMPQSTLASDGANLGTVLHEMLTRAAYRSAAEDMRGFLRSAYPSFGDIYAETAFGTPARVLVRLREKGMRREMDLWDLSDGMLRFLCLSAALLNPSPSSLVAIDEPEIGLHPKLLPIVADMLKTASETTQLLVTTHSPDLLNCFDIDDVAVMAREEDRVVWKRPGDRPTLKKMLASVTGDSLGDLHRSGELEAVE